MKKIALLLSIYLGANTAIAATNSVDVQIGVVITPICNVSATNMAFPSNLSTAENYALAYSSLLVECTKETSYRLLINAGLQPSTGMLPKPRLKHISKTEYLPYYLYVNNQLVTHNTYLINDVGKGIGAGTAISIEGELDLSQNVSVGNYSDTLTISVEY